MSRTRLKPANTQDQRGGSKLRWGLIALLCAGLVFGCAQVRKATYPRDFVYLEHKQLRNKMVQFSFYLRRLDEILLDDSDARGDQQQQVIELLDKIGAFTLELGSGVSTNHLVIDDHIDQFNIDLSNAMYNARANPPNYFAVGRLIGSCLGCHKYRGRGGRLAGAVTA